MNLRCKGWEGVLSSDSVPSRSENVLSPARSKRGLHSRILVEYRDESRPGESRHNGLLAPMLCVLGRSSTAGLLSRLLRMPNLCSSSSRAGLPSLLFAPNVPPRLFRLSPGLSDSRGNLCGLPLLALLRQLSKQSAHEGRPSRSTIGLSPIFLKHPSQRKQRLCQRRPEFSTKPPSLFSMRTARPHAAQSPLDPPFTVKHGRHKNRVPAPMVGDEGSGYIVASGGNGVEQI